MNRRYPQVVNCNYRDGSRVWTWNELYQGWMSLAEQHKLEEKCRTSTPAVITARAIL